MVEIDRSRIRVLLEREERRFAEEHPKSRALHERARKSLLYGVPMNWMIRCAGGFPLFVSEAHGARFTDVDGRGYLDLCLGDTGAMFGHSPAPAVEAVCEQVRRGVTLMLPTEDAVRVGEELQRRFGLPYWQIALTATDANRFAIRLAREITGRRWVLVFNGCYHGSVDEALISLVEGRPAAKAGNCGPAVDPATISRVVEFNDVAALERALAPRDVACVLCEPALTNCGIVLPEPGYHGILREITRRTGTLLILDETHTICTGPGGYTREHALEPDLLTIGKPIAGGLPAAAYGISEAVARLIVERTTVDTSDTSGIGGTLAGNALCLAAMRATLERVMTPAAYERTIPLARRFAEGVEGVIRSRALPWHVTRLGNRAEYAFRPTPPKNGGEAEAAMDADLDRLMHLMALNRGILLTPFHLMALVAPDVTEADIDRHTEVFAECVGELLA